MSKSFVRGVLQRTKVAGFYCLVSIGILFAATLVANVAGAGEQNLPGWVLTYIIFYSPAWIAFIFLAAFISEYVSRKITLAKAWPAEGTDTYLKELEKVKKHMNNPIRVDIYSRNVGISIVDIERRIGSGMLKGYVYNGKLFVENHV